MFEYLGWLMSLVGLCCIVGGLLRVLISWLFGRPLDKS